MEFNEKLQELRKRKGLTQEELAEELFVSRTAISKWESGRGYPNIDSLRSIAKFFSVTIDELLSGNEALRLAEEEQREKSRHFRALVFGLLDLGIAALLFLPFFGQRADGGVEGVSLLALTEIAPHMRTAYFAAVFATAGLGILALALQNSHGRFREERREQLSLLANILGALLFVLGRQPYAAMYLLLFLGIKGMLLWKRP